MKIRLSILTLASLGFVLLMHFPVLAQVDLGDLGMTATGSIEAGGYAQPVPYNDVARFQEYRDLAQQIIVPQLRLLLNDKNEKYYVRVDAVNVGQTNEMYNLRFGDYGLLDVQAQWLEIPHFFSQDVASTPYHQDGGDFTLSSRPTGFPSATGHNIRDWVNTNAKPFDMSLLEGVANVIVRYTPTPEWTFNANLNYQNPTGEQPFGGSFLFGANPGNFNVNELWVPTQYYIYNFGAGAEYARNGWVLGFQYQGSFFQDVYDTLTWDNPDISVPAGSTCQDSATFNKSTGLGSCRGRAAMYPSNQAHNFILTAAGQLPLNTRVMGSLAYGFWLQDAPFIPFTINSKLAQALPRTSLGGDIQPLFANVTIESNPIKPLELKATYSYYDYDNLTPTITFGSEKNKIRALNDVSSPWNATAYPFSFSMQDINLDPTYRLTETLAAHFVTHITTYHNGGLEVFQQDETTYGPALDWSPYSWLTMRADYQHAHRSSPGYNNNRTSLLEQNDNELELADLRRFDEAEVDVNQTSLYASVQPTEKLTLFAGFDYDDYNYPSSDFGLQHSSSYSPSLGMSYDPLPGVHLFSDYSWQAYDWNLQSIEEASVASDPFKTPKDIWRSYGRTQSNSVDFGFDIAIPKNWILRRPSHLKTQYTYVVGNDLIHSTGAIGASTVATIFPNTGSQFHELIVRYEYDLRDNIAVNIGYYFSHYGEHDFGVDNMTNWMETPQSTATSYSTFLGNTVIDPYNANVGFITVGFKF
jgi:MtrB/PioB family decaheme-associated outer membrane protein